MIPEPLDGRFEQSNAAVITMHLDIVAKVFHRIELGFTIDETDAGGVFTLKDFGFKIFKSERNGSAKVSVTRVSNQSHTGVSKCLDVAFSHWVPPALIKDCTNRRASSACSGLS